MASPSRRRRLDQGFTLIELLVVVVIVGILIGIAIPVYLQFRQGAYTVSVKSDLSTLRLAQQNYSASNTTFASTRQLVAADAALKLSEGSAAAVIWASKDAFCVGATNTRAPTDQSAPFASSGFPYRTYFYDSTTGKMNTTLCPQPSDASGMDGYLDDTGIH